MMAAAVLPLIVIYIFAVRLPAPMKVFLLVFSFSSAMYAMSLEWAAWGKNHLRLLGYGRAVVPISILAFLALGYWRSGHALWWVAAGNIAGYPRAGSRVLDLVEKASAGRVRHR